MTDQKQIQIIEETLRMMETQISICELNMARFHIDDPKDASPFHFGKWAAYKQMLEMMGVKVRCYFCPYLDLETDQVSRIIATWTDSEGYVWVLSSPFTWAWRSYEFESGKARLLK